jgi:carbon storage regulator
MLYLTRKIGEKVIINNEITVVVEGVRGNTVKLGFDFPDRNTVLREEVHNKIKAENLSASNTQIPFEFDQE